jgi:hypothetical protein
MQQRDATLKIYKDRQWATEPVGSTTKNGSQEAGNRACRSGIPEQTRRPTIGTESVGGTTRTAESTGVPEPPQRI